MLSSPIILEDNPQIAPESPGALYDATEIDEILTLRTMTLTDAEKDEARGDRSAGRGRVIDQVDTLPPDHLDRLHGAGAVPPAGHRRGHPTRRPFYGTVAARDVPDARHAMVGSRCRPVRVAGNRCHRDRRRASRPRVEGQAAAGRASHRCSGHVPRRPTGHGSGGFLRCGR